MRPITILLPAYNCEDTIKEAIESCLKQSFVDFELLVINDGSIDNTEKIIRQFSDVRITYLKNETNKGLIFTLNRGLDCSESNYIIRMDSDDIMYKNRLKIQFEFMERNPNIIASGCFMRKIGMQRGVCKQPVLDYDIKRKLLFDSPLFHPTVIIRKSIIDSFSIKYENEYKHAEDYKFWCDLSKYGNLANIDKIVLKYRINENQVSKIFSDSQSYTKNKIRKEILFKQLDNLNVDYEKNAKFDNDFLFVLINKLFLSCREKIELDIVFVLYMSIESDKLLRTKHFLKKMFWIGKGMSLKYVIIILLSCITDRWENYKISF